MTSREAGPTVLGSLFFHRRMISEEARACDTEIRDVSQARQTMWTRIRRKTTSVSSFALDIVDSVTPSGLQIATSIRSPAVSSLNENTVTMSNIRSQLGSPRGIPSLRHVHLGFVRYIRSLLVRSSR